jgi:hypothetical protein
VLHDIVGQEQPGTYSTRLACHKTSASFRPITIAPKPVTHSLAQHRRCQGTVGAASDQERRRRRESRRPRSAAIPPMSSIIPRLPDSLQSYLDDSLSSLSKAYSSLLPGPAQQYLNAAAKATRLDQLPPSTALTATLLVILTTLTMNRWTGSFPFGGSRIPPFGRPQYHPHVTEDDFSYITSDDLAAPPRAYDPRYPHGYPSMVAEDDVLLLRYKTITYRVQFPAYSIGDGRLQVRDIRERAKVVLGLPEGSEQRMKLLYKGPTAERTPSAMQRLQPEEPERDTMHRWGGASAIRRLGRQRERGRFHW